jgi:hypothetical protein
LWALPAVILVFATWQLLVAHGDAIEGRVLEATNPDAEPSAWALVPMPEAEVLVVWRGDLLDNFVDTSAQCVRMKSLRTDADGRFSVGGWWALRRARVFGIRAVSYAYKSGYEPIAPKAGLEGLWFPARGVHVMRRSSQPAQATRDAVLSAARGCPQMAQRLPQ